jgi:hypothetical protein
MSERYEEMTSDFKYDALALQKRARRSKLIFKILSVSLIAMSCSTNVFKKDFDSKEKLEISKEKKFFYIDISDSSRQKRIYSNNKKELKIISHLMLTGSISFEQLYLNAASQDALNSNTNNSSYSSGFGLDYSGKMILLFNFILINEETNLSTLKVFFNVERFDQLQYMCFNVNAIEDIAQFRSIQEVYGYEICEVVL